MTGAGFTFYQQAEDAIEAVQLAQAAAHEGRIDYPEDIGLLQKHRVQKILEYPVRRETAEALLADLLGGPAPGEGARVIPLTTNKPWMDLYSDIVCAIPVSENDDGPTVGWILFGMANE